MLKENLTMRRPSLPTHAAVAAVPLLLWGAIAAFAASPVARDDSVLLTDRYLETIEGVETYSILIDVLANDEDPDGDRLRIVTQGEFGSFPSIWTPSPAGTVQYLGAGVFELTVGREELGTESEVTFQYELEDASALATVRATLAGEEPAGDVVARDDTFDDPWACWVPLPVLANDTGLDRIQGFTQPTEGTVERHPADPHVLVYRGGPGGTFTYTGENSLDGSTDVATVNVQEGNLLGTKSLPSPFGAVQMADCFDRDDGVLLGGQEVAFVAGVTTIPAKTWTAAGLTHLNEAVTQTTSLPGGTNERRKAYTQYAFDPATAGGPAFQVQATFRAKSGTAKWVALALTHGNGSVFSESDLWLRLDVETGEVFLNGRWDGDGLQEKLGSASPDVDGYPFQLGGVNHLRIRYDTAPAVPKVDAWVNGVRVFSRIEHADITGSMTNAGFLLNYGQLAAEPGDVWFDDFEIREGTVNESRLSLKDGSVAGVSVENGSTLDVGPLHVGCTSAHDDCFGSRKQSLSLTNDGNVDLEISNLSLSGPSEWVLEQPTGTSMTVAPGTSAEIRVEVDALQTGPTASRLEFSTNDPDLPKFTLDLEAEVTQAPIADFVHFCEGLGCTFDAGRSTGVELGTFSYVWTFGSTGAFGGPIRSHSFPATGIYTVELNVSDQTGASHVTQRTVSIPPQAAFTFVCANDSRICDFDAALTTDGVASFTFDFGDGTTSSGTGDPGAVIVQHEYATSGRYDVTLTVQDGDGQMDAVTHEIVLTPTASFTSSCDPDTLTCELDASGSTPLLASYTWSFGDGSPETEGAVQEHRYATSGVFTVTLTVSDASGQTAVTSQAVSIPPQADFTFDCDGRLCQFDASASSPGVESYAWDFGHSDGTATGVAPLHEFPDGGDFDVALTVTDAFGQTDTTTKTVTVSNQELLLLLLLGER